MRLDIYLTEKGLYHSRSQASLAVKAGEVSVNGKTEKHPARDVSDLDELKIAQNSGKYVGRGAYKLCAALEGFPVTAKGKKCLDVGASTGGFTQVLLENGADHVFALDVGTDQLDLSLRSDPRVTSLENTDIREYAKNNTAMKFDLVTCDVSFISLTVVLFSMMSLLGDGGDLICLIKPQFEAGRGELSKKGLVLDRSTHIKVLNKILAYSAELGLVPIGVIPSPITGGDGNIEYLAHFRLHGDGGEPNFPNSDEIVMRAFSAEGRK